MPGLFAGSARRQGTVATVATVARHQSLPGLLLPRAGADTRSIPECFSFFPFFWPFCDSIVPLVMLGHPGSRMAAAIYSKMLLRMLLFLYYTVIYYNRTHSYRPAAVIILPRNVHCKPHPCLCILKHLHKLADLLSDLCCCLSLHRLCRIGQDLRIRCGAL